ncbi:MAG TPA: hypothetical protein VIQ55_09370 [Burkholderiales bacterium]
MPAKAEATRMILNRAGQVTRWYADPITRRFVALRYLPWLGALSLAWEVAQLPLYTPWYEAKGGYVAFSVAHCTAGDVLIGTASLLVVLTIGKEGSVEHWRWRRIALATALLGAGYTVFSEWRNVAILGSWAYAPAMPTLDIGGFELGLSPLAQWLAIPPLALYLSGEFHGKALQ